MYQKHTHSAAAAAALLVIGCLSGPEALAGKWEYAARGGLSSNYDSNPTLTADEFDPESTFRFLGFYQMEIETQDANTSFEVRPRITRDYYPDSDKSELESTDYVVPGNFAYFTPTARWNLGFSARSENILSTESVAETGGSQNEFRADDTRTIYSISPSLAWTPTPKDQFLLGYSWSKQDFDLDFTGRSDSEVNAVNTQYTRTITERQSIGLTGNLSNSEAEGNNCFNYIYYDPNEPLRPNSEPCTDSPLTAVELPVFDINGNVLGTDLRATQPVAGKNKNNSDNYSVTLDYRYNFSQTFSLNLSAGRQRTKSEQTVTDANGDPLLVFGNLVFINGQVIPITDVQEQTEVDSKSETYKVQLQKVTERSEFEFIAQRGTVLQNSTGTPQDRDEFRFNADTKWTAKLRSEINLQYWEQESVFLSADDDDTDAPGRLDRKTEFFSGELALIYRIAPKWSVRSSYRYRYRKRPEFLTADFEELKGTSDQIQVSITYLFKQIPTR